ncbi:hypothetical protein [Flavobacterium daejeonense]|uniref:hypothetical protein n=1 Tax=Flavobacterium daejeonense TaxID=350893 RepID=UPI00047E6E10|nr:hypothetical protein [Flavobacterium daejeonense]
MNFLNNIGFTNNTISIFGDSIIYDNELNKIYFTYHKAFFEPNFKNEMLSITRERFIPADFFNLINPLESAFIYEVYFFNSFLDAMAFYQIKKNISFNHALFVVTGNNPKFSYIQYLKKDYTNLKKFYLVYPNSFYGKMLDIKIACYLKGINNVSFILKDNILTVYYNSQSVSINRNYVTLSMIRKALNITLPYKTFKSKIAKSYFEELILNK